MEDIALMVLPFVVGISFGVWMLRWQYRTGERRLRTWAEKSEYICSSTMERILLAEAR